MSQPTFAPAELAITYPQAPDSEDHETLNIKERTST